MKYLGKREKEQIMQAEPGTVVLLNAPVGCGKTTFCLRELWRHCRLNHKNLLLLVNRSALRGQLRHQVLRELGLDKGVPVEERGILEADSLTISSYQYLQTVLETRICVPSEIRIGALRAKAFDYVVADEIHYLHTDSLFSASTRHLLKFPQIFPSAVRVYMSATLAPVRNLLLEMEEVEDLYESHQMLIERQLMPSRYANVGLRKMLAGTGMPLYRNMLEIDSIAKDYAYFMPVIYEETQSPIELIMAGIKERSGEKWLFFVDSKEKGKQIKAELIHQNITAAFVSSDSMDVDDERQMQFIREHGKFQVQVLLATTVIDNGISIIDPLVKNIVPCGYEEIGVVQQAGRVRVKNRGEKIRLFLCRHSVDFFNKKKFRLENQLRAYRVFAEGDESKVKNYLMAYGNEMLTGTVYKTGGEWHVNKLTEIALEYYVKEIQDNILRIRQGEDGYICKLLDFFDLSYNPAEDMQKQAREEATEKFLRFLRQSCGSRVEDWNFFRQKFREFYEQATGIKLCSGRNDRLPGVCKIRKILHEYGFEITDKAQGYVIKEAKTCIY